MKVFFDTNAYIAEALLGEATQAALTATVAAAWHIYTCRTVLEEVERILVDRLHARPFAARQAMQRCHRRAHVVIERPSKHRVPGDPHDSPILGAACDAGVDYLVTNDQLLLELDPYEGVRIISMTDYVTLLQNEGLLS